MCVYDEVLQEMLDEAEGVDTSTGSNGNISCPNGNISCPNGNSDLDRPNRRVLNIAEYGILKTLCKINLPVDQEAKTTLSHRLQNWLEGGAIRRGDFNGSFDDRRLKFHRSIVEMLRLLADKPVNCKPVERSEVVGKVEIEVEVGTDCLSVHGLEDVGNVEESISQFDSRSGGRSHGGQVRPRSNPKPSSLDTSLDGFTSSISPYSLLVGSGSGFPVADVRDVNIDVGTDVESPRVLNGQPNDADCQTADKDPAGDGVILADRDWALATCHDKHIGESTDDIKLAKASSTDKHTKNDSSLHHFWDYLFPEVPESIKDSKPPEELLFGKYEFPGEWENVQLFDTILDTFDRVHYNDGVDAENTKIVGLVNAEMVRA